MGEQRAEEDRGQHRSPGDDQAASGREKAAESQPAGRYAPGMGAAPRAPSRPGIWAAELGLYSRGFLSDHSFTHMWIRVHVASPTCQALGRAQH